MNIKVGILTAPRIDWEQRERTFVLKNVRIGIGFHWDRYEQQEFEGQLTIRTNADGTQTAINTIGLEDYLTSVISSEMSAECPLELLKAHAVIARSWVMRAVEHHLHEGYDVCADDHCQRYEGIRRRNAKAVEAVRMTAGQVLMYDGQICDCRYHKCCGGRTEEYETCWEDVHYPYLESVECPYCAEAQQNPDLLRAILNDYDQETVDFHDWSVTYTPQQLRAIIRDKSGVDCGDIQDLIPLQRGPSGRISRLRIVGSHCTHEIAKELTIRQTLSPSTLYSSNFQIKHDSSFTLIGHGWGHGVGLCQIGAAVMAQKGIAYDAILSHYYPHAMLHS